MQEIKSKSGFIHTLFMVVFYLVSCESPRRYEEFYDTGELKIKGETENDRRVGEWVVYDKSGDITNKLFYKNDSLFKRNTYVKGRLKIEEMLTDSVRNGKLNLYYADGTLQMLKTFENGKEKGLFKEFYPDGTLQVSYVRNEDQILDFKQFFSNGELFVEAEDLDNGINHFSDSLRNKTFDVLYKNGEIVDTLKSYQ